MKVDRKFLRAGLPIILIAAAIAAGITLNNPTNNTPINETQTNSSSPQTSSSPQSSSPSTQTPSSSTQSSSSSSSSTPPETTTETETTDEPPKEGSALSTFDVNIQLTQVSWKAAISGTYYSYVYGVISWEPVTYVRYYEVSPNYNGNNQHAENLYSGGDFRDWGKPGKETRPFLWDEEKIQILGPESVAQQYWENYATTYNASGTWLDIDRDGTRTYGPKLWHDGMHGMKVIAVSSTFFEKEKLSSVEILEIENEMWEFMESYTRSWTFTVRGIS